MRSVAAVAAVLLGLSAGAVGARDAEPNVVSPLPPIAANPDWTGFYVGIKAGMQFHSANDDRITTTPGVFDAHTRIGELGRRRTAGVYGGFNYHLPGPFVLGLEADLTSLDGNYRLDGPNSDLLLKISRVDTFAGRFGFLVTPTTLTYGKAGVSRMKLSGFDDVLPLKTFQRTVNGTSYGVGIESIITENLLVRIEADRTRANKDLVLTNNTEKYRAEVLQVTAGAALKFNPGIPHSTTQASWLPTPPAITRSWTSVYVGADIGKSGSRVETNGLGGANSLVGPFTDTRTSHGFFAGGDLQLPRFLQVGPTLVVGAQYSKSWVKAVFDEPNGTGSIIVINRFANINDIRAITGRLGVLVTPSTLVYGRAGPAHMTFTASPDYFNTIQPLNSGAGTFNMKATQAGGGFETMITDHVAFRVEGLFTKAHDEVILNGLNRLGEFHLRPAVTSATVGLLAKY